MAGQREGVKERCTDKNRPAIIAKNDEKQQIDHCIRQKVHENDLRRAVVRSVSIQAFHHHKGCAGHKGIKHGAHEKSWLARKFQPESEEQPDRYHQKFEQERILPDSHFCSCFCGEKRFAAQEHHQCRCRQKPANDHIAPGAAHEHDGTQLEQPPLTEK